MNNLDLLEFSLAHPEPYVEAAYAKECIVIAPAGHENVLMQANREIADQITAFKVAAAVGNDAMCANIVDRLIALLDTAGINNGEFANFWGVFDVSYSSYTGMTGSERRSFLREILPQYLKRRHDIYQSHGYSPNVLQVRSDSTAHKRSGQLGRRKVETQLLAAGLSSISWGATVEEFLDRDRVYIRTDGDGKALFQQVLAELGLWFRWSAEKQDKFPDFALMLGGRLTVVEHKHMKEGGGGQAKQVGEIIDFIRQSDPQASYVSYLDGIYFNALAAAGDVGKSAAQIKQIRQALRANRYNYFVNTAGFEARLRTAGVAS